MTATVLTSATLSVDGRFDYVRSRLGVRQAHEARLPSEFDYTRQAILYLPKKMPDPRSPEFVAAAAREVVEILKRTRGRAFVLFTSYANLRQVHQFAAARDPLSDPRPGHARRARRCCASSRRRRNAVLFATSSFWQGVDVVGESLSCVIIDKLPFASPGDPITVGPHRSDQRGRRERLRRVPDPAGHPGAPAGSGPADPAPPGPRRARRPRPAAADDGLRTPISGLFAPRTRNARPRKRSISSSMPEIRAGAVRPILKWAGGKRQLLPELRPFYPRRSSGYFEPFLGQRRRVPRSAQPRPARTAATCGSRTSTPTSSAATAPSATRRRASSPALAQARSGLPVAAARRISTTCATRRSIPRGARS